MSAPRNLNELFLTAVERFGSKQAALRVKREGEWQDITHQELARRVKHAALGLREIGIQPGDHVALKDSERRAVFGILEQVADLLLAQGFREPGGVRRER